MKLKKVISTILLITLLISFIEPFTNIVKAETDEEVEVFYDDFSGDTLDTSKWLIAEKAWGGGNGGVIPENVSISNGILKLEGHGDKYTGDLPGVNREDGTRTGAAIATRDYFGSGSYEVVAKVAPELGVCSAIWTFEYEEYYPEDEKYKELGATGSYYAVNHEIDIEMPGRPSNGADPSYEYALCNTWIGEKGGEYTTGYTKLPYAQNDGEFHKYRFDWHTGDEGETPRVEFYFDDELVTTNTTHIPTNAGRLWIGLWFPNGWAGKEADFDTTVFEIDSVKITPFYEAGDTPENETYGKDGWAVDSFPEDIEDESYDHIINGNFSDGKNGWTLSGDADVKDGYGILTSGSKTDTLSQTITLKPKMTYTITADVITDGTEVSIGVKKLNGEGDMSIKVSESGNVVYTFVTPKSINEMKAYIEVLRYQNINNEVRVDNVELYAGYLKSLPIEPVIREKATFDKSVGACGFIDDPIEGVLSGLGTVREYHNYRWVTEVPNECRFTQGTWWNWDSYYKKLKDLGVDVVPCIQGTSKADRDNYNGNKQQKPINSGEDSLDPESYKEHASTMFQYAARYGSVEVDDSKLLLEDGQTRVSGLGYLEYYENWNEPDKTWEGEESHFSGAELAAMCSSDYDGHEGRLGDTYGIKNADPNAKLVMGGIASGRSTVEYLEEMKAWAEENRTDKKIPIDVINFHMYNGKACPENNGYIENFEKIVAWRDENAPELEIWMTEFGWDTNTASEHGATYEDQRNFLMRTYLIANAHGIDRSTMYMTRDTSPQSTTGKYATSGLTTQGNKEKKTSWYGVATLKNTLKDFMIDKVVEESEYLYNYKLVNEKTNETCYVLWSPTQDGSKIDNYTLDLGNVETATLTTFVDKSTDGNVQELEVKDGKVIVNVGETPIFIKTQNIEDEPEEKTPLTFKMKLTADKEEVKKGDKVTITASIDEISKNGSNGLLAIFGKLEYDKNVLEIDTDSITGLGTWSFSKGDYNLNNFKFVADNKDYVTSKEDVLKITFTVKEDTKVDETTIKLTGINGGTGQIENGLIFTDDTSLTIKLKDKELLLGDVDLDGEITVNDIAKLKLHLIEKELLEGDELVTADLDQDNEITINDLASLKVLFLSIDNK